jgi:hypothetical protein
MNDDDGVRKMIDVDGLPGCTLYLLVDLFPNAAVMTGSDTSYACPE